MGGSRDLLARLDLALSRGQRVEGHTAGAGPDKIAALAAGGLSSDHEPITASEVLERARQGIAVMLRESSLRPDLAGLLDALRTAPALVSRLMLTADGSMPAFIRDHGFVDHLIRVAMKRGVAPVDAYRMATLNPATYIGREADLGGVAPGRYADLCLLRDLGEPRPEVVVARGRVAARDGNVVVSVPEPDWSRALTTPEARLTVRWRARPDDFRLPPRDRYPVIRLVSAVITRLEDRPRAEGDLSPRWWTGRAMGGAGAGHRLRRPRRRPGLHDHHRLQHPGARPAAGVDGARGQSPARGPRRRRARGRRPRELRDADAARRRHDAPVSPAAAAQEDALRAALVARGYPHHEPLFTLFFLAADFLPFVRLSPRGVWDVKLGRVLLPRRARRP